MDKAIVLVEPTNTKLMTPSLLLRGNTLEPYAIESIGAYLLHKGLDNVHILQQYTLSDAELVKEIVSINPSIIGFSALSCDYPRVLSIAIEIKKHLPNLQIVLGGYHPTLNIQETLKNDCVDFVVFGEGEITLFELVNSIIKGSKDFQQIAGLAYKDNSRILVNSARSRVSNLDDLPLTIRSQEVLQRSRQWNLSYPSPSKQTGVAQVNYSRGCQFNCTFCVSPFLWSRGTDSQSSGAITYRSVDHIIAEMIEIKRKYGVNFFYFNDLTINASESRLNELCNAIISSGLHNPGMDSNTEEDISKNIHWFCLAKIGLSVETAKLMAKAGCSKIGFGIESFYQKGQLEMRKPYKGLMDIKETLENTDSVGIINRAYIVLGRPGETSESIDATIEGLLSTKVDQIRVAYFTPFPGTDLYAEYKEKNMLTETDYSKFDGDTPVVKCKNISVPELIEARKRIVNSFYTSPIYIQRCRDKIKRFPRLYESYVSFANELFDLSKGTINIKEAL